MNTGDQSARLYDLLRTAVQQALDERKPDRDWAFEHCRTLDDVMQSEAIILTLASFRLRLLCLLHIDMSVGGLMHELLAGEAGEQDRGDHEDYIREFGNSVCGNLKRDLQGGAPLLGLSTPNILNRGSLAMLEGISGGAVAHLTVSVAGGEHFPMGASALLYVHTGYDFEVPEVAADAGSDSGELEMF